MNFDEYQQRAKLTSKQTEIGGDPLVYSVLGLNDEAGEVAGKLKKLYRDHGGVLDNEQKHLLMKELGDVLWYLADCATGLGVRLDVIAGMNLHKLSDRQERGVIGGEGDER